MPLADMLPTGRLRLPLIAAPMFLASELVLACCRAGIIGSFRRRTSGRVRGLMPWLTEIGEGLAVIEAEAGPPPPYAVNLIVHRSNADLEDELEMVIRHRVPIVITSLGAVPELVARVHDYGGLVFHDVINLRHARRPSGPGLTG